MVYALDKHVWIYNRNERLGTTLGHVVSMYEHRNWISNRMNTLTNTQFFCGESKKGLLQGREDQRALWRLRDSIERVRNFEPAF